MITNRVAEFIIEKEDKDTAARIGTLSLNGFTIKTPVVWLGHNFKGPVEIWRESRKRLPGFLLNACEILENRSIHQALSQKGIKKYLNYNGPVMMDSGGFLFQRSHTMKVRPERIIDLYNKLEALRKRKR